MIKLFNTLSRKKEEFKPIKKGQVGMYVCGPTVNDVPHIGHGRQKVVFDVLRKLFIYQGYKVKYVSNITDIDDKIINKANDLGVDIKELTKKNLAFHIEDYRKLNVSDPDVQPKATEYVKEMIELVEILEKKGYAYTIEGDGVYFNTSKFSKYGKLSHQDLSEKKTKSRIVKNEDKKNKSDFVLWKFSKPGEPEWKASFGTGRPGWHIECSAMDKAILGLPFDIHGGGQDLIFPHHEDELAQSECAFDKKVANYWVHNGMVTVDNIKMSKSLGNFRTIRDLLKNYSGITLRFFVLLTHYRKAMEFSESGLDAAKTTLERIKRKIAEIKKTEHKGEDKTEEYEKEFLDAINDDINTPLAIQVLHKMIDDSDFDSKKRLKLIGKFDEVLGLELLEFKEEKVSVPEEVKMLVGLREQARKSKNWAEADILRQRIKEFGFEVSDTPEGPKVNRGQ